jgi:hypothetical protein
MLIQLSKLIEILFSGKEFKELLSGKDARGR